MGIASENTGLSWEIEVKNSILILNSDNKACLSLLGFSKPELESNSRLWIDNISKNFQVRILANRKGLFKGDELEYVYVFKHPNDGIIQIKESIQKVVRGDKKCIQGISERIETKSEDELRDVDSSLKSIIELSEKLGDGVIIMSDKNKVIHASKIAQIFTEQNRESVKEYGFNILGKVTSEDGKLWSSEDLLELLWMGDADRYPSKFRMVLKSGIIRYMSFSFALHQHSDYPYLLGVIILRDISRDTFEQIKLAEREQELSLIFENAPVGILFYDANGVIIQVNQNLCSFLGVTKAQMINLNMITTLENVEIVRALEKTLDGKRSSYRGEYVSLMSGKRVQISANFNPILDAENDVVGGIGIIEDVTDEYINQRRIAYLNANLERIVENSDDGICSIDLKGNFTFFNDRFEKYCEEFVPEKKLISNDRVSGFFEKIIPDIKLEKALRLVNLGQKIVKKFNALDANNKRRYLDAVLSPLKDQDQKIIGTSVFIKDNTELVEKAEQIKSNQQLLQSITTNLSEGVYRITKDKGLIYANDSFYEMFGFESNQTITDQMLYDIYVDPTQRDEMFNEIDEQGKISNREVLLKKKDGSHFWAMLNINKVNFENQVWYDGVLSDINDRKVTEMRIRSSEERYKFLYDDNPSIYFTVDTKGLIKNVNVYGAHQLGYDTDDLLNTQYTLLFHPSEQLQVLNEIQDLDKQISKQQTWEFRKQHRNGEYIWFRDTVRLVENPSTKEQLILVSSININELKKYALELQISEESYKNLFEFASEAIYIFNDDFHIVDINNTASSWYGYKKEELIGKSAMYISAEKKNDANQVIEWLQKAKRGVQQDVEIWGKRKNGETFLKKVRLRKGTYFGKDVLIAFARDITISRLLEEERTHLIADLTKQNRNLQHFSYVVSHDLRAPVANILSLSSVFSLPSLDQKTKEQVINGLRESANNLDKTIKDLNNILSVRTEAHSLREFISFQDILSSVEASLSKLIIMNNAHITHDFSEVDGMFAINSYMQSIFFNLVGNAIKYRKKDVFPKIHIRSRKNKEKVELHFSDNGLGIDLSKYRKKLFELYQRISDRTDGKGIGLYLVKTQVESLSGAIEVESKLGEGTTFILTFPISN